MSKLCKRILLILAVFISFLTLFACSAIQIDTYHVELPQDKYQLRVGQEIEALPIVSKNGQECDLEVSYHSYDDSNLAANSTAGSCVNPPNMIWLILSSWVLAAALSTGWLYPWTAAHQEDIPSISSLPSARVIVTPSALDTR